MRRITFLILMLFYVLPLLSQSEYFHKRGESFEQNIPTPESVIGIKPGERHVSHAEIENYCKILSQKSDRVELYRFGESYEGKGLYLLAVSSEKNIKDLETIRGRNMAIIEAGFAGEKFPQNTQSNTVFVWLAAAVHGDETSSPDAMLELAYQFAAGNSDEIKSVLENTVILIDPLQNPDGRQRTIEHYQHVGSLKGDIYPQALEHQLNWPYGRGNHYLFDMNRDWFPLTQRESVARVTMYKKWMPHVFVDLHEMGHNSGYYFSPPADPVNENIPQITRDWWKVFGQANARAFDKNGWQYWNRDIFDQYYPGYGESWPTFYGAIGMTYEQASSEGKAIERKDKEVLTFLQSVWQHFTASMSTVFTASENRDKLIQYFHQYYRTAREKYQNDEIKAVVINSAKYPYEGYELAQKLKIMGIDVAQAQKNFSIKGLSPYNAKKRERSFAQNSLIINLNQPSYFLIRTMMDHRQELPEEFKKGERERFKQKRPGKIYDVTAWSLPLAMGLDYCLATDRIGVKQSDFIIDKQTGLNAKAEFAYLLPYQGKNTTMALVALLNNKAYVAVAREAFTIGTTNYPRGTLVVSIRKNDKSIHELIALIQSKLYVEVDAVNSGWTDDGISLGSTKVQHIKKPRVAIVAGRPTSTYTYGQVWWLFEQVYNLEFSGIKSRTLKNIKLHEFDVLIIPGAWGNYKEYLNKKVVEKMRFWVQEGGVLITLGGNSNFFIDDSSSFVKTKTGLEKDNNKEDKVKIHDIEGAYVKGKALDFHYLTTGLDNSMPLFVSGKTYFQNSDKVFNVVNFADKDDFRLSGLIWPAVAEQWGGKAYLTNENVGKGQVILFAVNPNFRGFHEATQKLFLNAVLFAPNMRERMR